MAEIRNDNIAEAIAAAAAKNEILWDLKCNMPEDPDEECRDGSLILMVNEKLFASIDAEFGTYEDDNPYNTFLSNLKFNTENGGLSLDELYIWTVATAQLHDLFIKWGDDYVSYDLNDEDSEGNPFCGYDEDYVAGHRKAIILDRFGEAEAKRKDAERQAERENR